MRQRPFVAAATILSLVLLSGVPMGSTVAAQSSLATPEQFLGHRVGADNKLARWDKIVEYLQLVAANSPRVKVRDLGKTTLGERFISVEVASAGTHAKLDRFKGLQRKLYFQGGAPTPAERDEIFRDGKAVVAITCNMHSSEIGSSQMVLELVHRLATEDSPLVSKILDRVILVLVPSLNPDGQILVTDWFNKNVGTEFANSPMPWLYHHYVGHDNNRDMYAFTQVESQLTARLLWHDWFPAVWLDQHQMGNSGARIFVMPATDPINPNVHPLIYRWNGILGQAQAAALEAAGKDGIIYNSTYTNFWQGAMAWSGWWHNQVGLLTEVASARVAAPVDQLKATPGAPPPAAEGQGRRGGSEAAGPLPAPRDISPRTEYPRPWLGGRWTLRDIVDYELIATMGLLEAAADQRDALLRQIYEVNRVTVEGSGPNMPKAIVIPVATQPDPRAAAHLAEKLQIARRRGVAGQGGVRGQGLALRRGNARRPHEPGVCPLRQGPAGEADIPRGASHAHRAPRPPYDVTAWSLGMQMGVDTVFLEQPAAGRRAAGAGCHRPRGRAPAMSRATAPRTDSTTAGADDAHRDQQAVEGRRHGGVRTGTGTAARVVVAGVPRARLDTLARELGLDVRAVPAKEADRAVAVKAPRVGLYQPWTASMDEGWTRFVLDRYEFGPKTVRNADIKAGKLRERFDVLRLCRPAGARDPGGQRRRLGEAGVPGGDCRRRTRGAARVPQGGRHARDPRQCLRPRDPEVAGPGAEPETRPDEGRAFRARAPSCGWRWTPPARIGYGVAAETRGFYNNSPFFALTEGFASQRATVVARYPNTEVLASGWLKGEELMAGRAAVVQVDLNPGRIVLFGLRPQHRAQTTATFPLLFNALYQAASGRLP